MKINNKGNSNLTVTQVNGIHRILLNQNNEAINVKTGMINIFNVFLKQNYLEFENRMKFELIMDNLFCLLLPEICLDLMEERRST